MFGEILIFDDKETKKNSFHCYNRPLKSDDRYNFDHITMKVSEKGYFYQKTLKILLSWRIM